MNHSLEDCSTEAEHDCLFHHDCYEFRDICDEASSKAYNPEMVRSQIDPLVVDKLINNYFRFASSDIPSITDALESVHLLIEEVVFNTQSEDKSDTSNHLRNELAEKKSIDYRGHHHYLNIGRNRRASTKPYNIIVNQRKALEFAIELGISTSALANDPSLIIKFLYTVMFGLKLWDIMTVNLSNDDVDAIVFMCNKKAFCKETAIPKDEVIISKRVYNNLIRMRSLKETDDGKVYLAENVRISSG